MRPALQRESWGWVIFVLYKQADSLLSLIAEDCSPPTSPLPNQLNTPVEDHAF